MASMLLSSTMCAEAYELTSRHKEFKLYNVISSYEEPAIRTWGERPATVYCCQAPAKVEVISDNVLTIGVSVQVLLDGIMRFPQTTSYSVGIGEGEDIEDCKAGDSFVIDRPGLYYLSSRNMDLLVEGYNLIVKGDVRPTASKFYIDGKEMTFDAYNVGGNNYFKLRDIAMALKGSAKEFNVGWDAEKASISLTKNTPYEAVGGELVSGSATVAEAKPNLASTYLDGEAYGFVSYTIRNNNYFMLRNLGEAFDFDVEWDASTNSIHINTNSGYK